jgi:hypothetical protein
MSMVRVLFGMDWQVMGFGDFSSMPGETDMILRNSNTGGVEVYDISNNQITGSAFMGAVGLNWQFSGVGNFSGFDDPSAAGGRGTFAFGINDAGQIVGLHRDSLSRFAPYAGDSKFLSSSVASPEGSHLWL